ncbi:MAG: hypothetical protein R3F22_03670 [Lysobacteraceae bacterium]
MFHAAPGHHRRQPGRFFALCFAALFSLFVLPARAQFTLPGTLSVSPSAATGGGTVLLGATHLADGRYVVIIKNASVSATLLDMPGGTGQLQEYVTLPTLAAGSYTVELRIDGNLTQSRSYRVLPPLTVTPSTASPRAGNSFGFSVSGLTDGTLSLVYAGKVAFGPVNVSAGSFSGKFTLPTDRPASLPASVVLEARNAIGKTAPRVGSTTLSVQTPNRSPFIQVGSSTPPSSINLRDPLSMSGNVVINDLDPADSDVQYWWRDQIGRVVPMGAQLSSVQANGQFTAAMRAPQLATLSAWRAEGSGSVFAVGKIKDHQGNLQQHPSPWQNLSVDPAFNDTVDITLRLRGSDGLPIEGARVVLRTDNLEDLYPPNSNKAPVRIDGGSTPVQVPSQFDASPVNDEIVGCPDDLERQATNASGNATFSFGLALPQGAVNLDGSGPPPMATIAPTEQCISPDNNTPELCTLIDPAAINVHLEVIAAHKGYGWLTTDSIANSGYVREFPLTIDLRIDRYTRHIDSKVCVPDTNPTDAILTACEEGGADGDQVMDLVLPKLANSGLQLAAPRWGLAYRDTLAGGVIVYQPLPDLGDFDGKASFVPPTPAARTFSIGYVRGAGNALSGAELHLVGRAQPIMLTNTDEQFSCDAAATEYLTAALPADVLEGLRFPRKVFGITGDSLYGWVVAHEEGTSRTGVRAFRIDFKRPSAAIASTASLPGVQVRIQDPHSVRVTVPPNDATGKTDTGAAHASGCGDPECDGYDELKNKTNSATAHLDQQFCLPEGTTVCGSVSGVNSSHTQYNREPPTPPPGELFVGGDAGQSTARHWETLYDLTIPLFRWYWGVPEVFSARVFADLGIKAEYLLAYAMKPLEPRNSYVETGGRLDIYVPIGVDVSVLMGILVDAGAMITVALQGEVVGRANADATTCVDESLNFRMDFDYWVEIGCPIDFPLDPTCWIPNIEGSENIFRKVISETNGCLNRPASGNAWNLLTQELDKAASGHATGKANPEMIVRPADRRAMNRHPALAVDSAGNQLLLYVNSLGKLVAAHTPVDGVADTAQLSDGWGIRDVAVMHYGVDRAVAVWAESDLRAAPAPGDDLARHQFLRFAVFDGMTWTAADDLTAPGYGEGGVRLARCLPRPAFYRQDCSGNKVSLVFQRNTARVTGGESHIYLSDFDGVSWSSPRRVDQSGSFNITPAIAYQNAVPVVAWVRYAPDAVDLSDIDKRNLAMRTMDGLAIEQVDTRNSRVAQPDLATTSNGRLALAFTRAAVNDAFIGTRQGLQIGYRDCSSSPCLIRAFAVKDAHGRLVYGERPRVVANDSDGVNVIFRALSVGALPGVADPENNRMPDDPVGIRESRGELLNIVSGLTANQTRVQLQSNDGGGHLQPAVAFNAASGQVVTVSTLLPAIGNTIVAKRDSDVRLLAKTTALDDGLQMATLPALPDLAMESLESSATQLTPGDDISVHVSVINAGNAWTPDANRSATLRLYWDTPQTRETLYGNLAIPTLAPGQRFETDLQIPVPADFHDDERQTLRAELLVDDPDGEIDGANNGATLSIGGMPVPQNLHALSAAGSRIVNLTWDDPADSRVAGYRIWVDGPDGTPMPMGSSFNLGFADLSALYGFDRSYRVSTYSERGVESELSKPLRAAPSPAILAGESARVFSDSFE